MSVEKDWRINFKMKNGKRDDSAPGDILALLEDLNAGEVEEFVLLGDTPWSEWSSTFGTTSISADERICDALEECSRQFPEFLFQAVVFDCATHEAYAANFNNGEREYLEVCFALSTPKRVVY